MFKHKKTKQTYLIFKAVDDICLEKYHNQLCEMVMNKVVRGTSIFE